MTTSSSTIAAASDMPAAPAKKARVVSLDAFRAITVALMIFMDHPSIIAALPQFLVHPEWHGFRLPDAVFPAFIFIAGVSLAYSISRKKQLDFRAATFVFVRRIAFLIALGLMLNFFKYGLPLRYLGVLQRIGLALLIAWPFTRKPMRWGLIAAVLLLVAHSVVLLFVGAPGVTPGTLNGPEHSISAYVDTAVLGMPHTYWGAGFDPEGVLGTLTAGAEALLGLAVGMWLIRYPKDKRRLGQLAAAGALSAAVGISLSPIIPVNKELWTASFVLLSAGLCTIVLVAMYAIADLDGKKHWFNWLVPLGRNALLIYICSNMLVVAARMIKIPVNGEEWNLFRGSGRFLACYMAPMWASIVVSATEVALWFVVAEYLHRKKLYFKL